MAAWKGELVLDVLKVCASEVKRRDHVSIPTRFNSSSTNQL
jgi:hypothetical protein